MEGCSTNCGVVICGAKRRLPDTVHQRVQSKKTLQIESSPALLIKRNGKRSIGKSKPLRVRIVNFNYNFCLK